MARGYVRWERTVALGFSDGVNVELGMANTRGVAQGLVERNWITITVLAAKLTARRRLSGDEVRGIVHGVGCDAQGWNY